MKNDENNSVRGIIIQTVFFDFAPLLVVAYVIVFPAKKIPMWGLVLAGILAAWCIVGLVRNIKTIHSAYSRRT